MVDVVFFGTNRAGERIYEWLVERADANVLALITDESQYETVERLEPDLIVSAGFRHIVPEWVLEIPDQGAVNCHLAYLPENRGMNPNVWSIVEGTPAGVSLHYMVPEVDAGPVIARREVEKRIEDNGKSLYRRLEGAMFNLFADTWTEIADGAVDTIEQSPDEGKYHYQDAFQDLCAIDTDEQVRVGDFIDRLRALTFPPYDNAYIKEDGTRYYLELSITPEEDSGTEGVHWNMPQYGE